MSATAERRRHRVIPENQQRSDEAAEALVMLARCIHLRRRAAANDPMAYAWGQVIIGGEHYPLDGAVCDWLDVHVWPRGWHVIRRPRNRA
jgi:hypothetical protein